MGNLSQEIKLIILLSIFLLTIGIGIIILVLIYQKKQLQYLREKEQLKVSFEKQILESKLEIQEQTMKHISQEIHDNIGQVLTLIKMNINIMNPDDVSTIREKIKDSKLLITKAINDLRSLSKSLNTDHISETGLLNSIAHEVEIIRKNSHYNVHFRTTGAVYRLDNQKELILFRIFQELVNNIIKHAGASAINIDLHYELTQFTLEIMDNGKGFKAEEKEGLSSQNESGLGIKNIKNRAMLIGAYLKIESMENQGTHIRISLPVTH